MTKCHFGVQEVDFLGRTITSKGVAPQKQKIAKFLEKVKFPRSKKALQRYIGFLNYYQKYIPRLAERLTPFFQLLKTTDAKTKIPITPDIMKDFKEINETLDRCCQLALRQPLPGKQLVLMTDASFQAAGYAVLIEDDPNQKYTSTRKTNAPIAYGSKTYSPSQIKKSVYAKEILTIYIAFKEFGIWTYILGCHQTSDHHDRQQIRHQILSNKYDPATPMECLRFCIAISFYYCTHSRGNEHCSRFFISIGNGSKRKNSFKNQRRHSNKSD